jgi:glyoxylase I family protein
MRNLLRAGASGLLLVLMMLGAGLVLWIGVPLGWLWVGSQVQGATDSIGTAILVMLVGVVASIVAVVPILGWLNRKHLELRAARGLDTHGQTALEAVMTVSVTIAVIVFVIWFFVIAGPGPSLAHARFSLAEPRPYFRRRPLVEERRLRIAGLHHVTVICQDVERSVDFYRNLLGMRLVKQTVNEDDRGARHLFFGDDEGRPGTMVTCLEYPELDEGTVGRGSTHHFALTVETEEELDGWHGYLRSRGIPCTDVMDRTYFKSLYMRDPDGHIVELATALPGLTVDEPLEELGRRPVGS